MARGLSLVGIGLFFGAGIGFLLAAANGVTLDGHDHSDHYGHGGANASHDHSNLIALDEANAPQLAIQITPDAKSGHNLFLDVQNFEFAPQDVNQANRQNAGHAHIYLNGQKLMRLYGPWVHLTNLPKGEVKISATLNANDHSSFAVNGQVIEASTTLTVE